MIDKTEIIILAAGKGTRMGEIDIPKCLVFVKGIPMIQRLMLNIEKSLINKPLIVVGYLADQVKEYFGDRARFAYQNEQKGTAHATSIALENLLPNTKYVIVLYSDHPFVSDNTINKLISDLDKYPVVMATTEATDFNGFKNWGRIIYSKKGNIDKIVEYKDADEQIKAISIVNPGFYAFRVDWLKKALQKVKPINAQGEYYLTDVIHITREAGYIIGEVKIDPKEAIGLNSKNELEYVENLID